MKKKGKKKFIVLGIIIILAIATSLFILLKNENRLTPEEREWLTTSANKIQNIHVINDENVFGMNGEGIFYDFIKDFQETYNITLNNITFKKGETVSGALLTADNNITPNALEFYQDHYVYVSKKKEPITNINDLKNQKVGILAENATYLNSNLSYLNIQFMKYNTKNELLKALENGNETAIIVPRMEYIDNILKNDYQINYHFSDVLYHYYMTDVENSRLLSTMKKHFITWYKENFDTSLATEERKLFAKSLNIEEKDLVDLQRENITYGLVNNSPYEILTSGNVGGIMTEYLKEFSKFSKIDIDYARYDNSKKLIKEITNNKVKLYMNYFTQNSNGAEIPTSIPLNYNIYVYENNPLVVNSIESLKGKTIYVEENTLLLTELQKVSNLTIKAYNREKDWKKIIKDKKAILVIDENLGDYYHKHDIKKFQKVYTGQTKVTYSLKSMNNDTFNQLLTKYLNYLDNNQLHLTGIYANTKTEQKGNVINKIAEYALYIIVLIGIILALIYHNSKKVRIAKKIKKEDKLKFIDQLTSLKNRNYLNENMPSWNKNTIYPQSVIVIDLKKLQEINDTLGYEEGDKQIQSAANTLIRTQLDSSDIIRTDGTEFMIYLVGYSQKQITSYIHKLNKEFKNLPYDYGANIDYSMIEDDLKNIEDAINECLEKIKKQKEEQKEEKE